MMSKFCLFVAKGCNDKEIDKAVQCHSTFSILISGDPVRAVGRFKNKSYLNIFKIRKVSDDDTSYVKRLTSIGSFALKKSLK